MSSSAAVAAPEVEMGLRKSLLLDDELPEKKVQLPNFRKVSIRTPLMEATAQRKRRKKKEKMKKALRSGLVGFINTFWKLGFIIIF